ncbi:MAG: oligosaccharide flippase family protein [Elusimicrobiota bacterium]|nr:oligosaccharide flippase family protein [Elusimicrobiota bacterium]
MSEPRSFRFARHFRWSLLGQAATAAASFLTAPYLIKGLGLESYGLYIILQSAVNYLMLATMGAGSSAFRHIAAAKAEKDGALLRSSLRHSLLFHGPVLLLAAAAAVWAARPLLAGLFQVPEPLMASGVRVLWAAAVGAVFFSLSACAGSALQGLQRFDAYNLLLFLQTGLTPLLAVALVRAGGGMETVAWAYALVQALGAAASWAWLRRIIDGSGLGAARGGKALSLRDFASWSFGMWLGQIAGIMGGQLDRVFAARHVSLAGMTLYAVPVGLLQRLSIVPATFTSIAMPMLGELRGEEHRGALRTLYLRQLRLLLWLGLPGLVLLFSLMPQFLSLWLGGRFGDDSVWPARLQLFAQVFALLTALPSSAALAVGAPWMLPVLAWSQALLSVAGWAWFVPRWGLVGVGMGALLGQALPALFYLPLVHRRVLGLDAGRVFFEGLLPPAVCAGAMLAVVFPFHDRATSWLLLAAFAAAGLSAYGLTAWVLLGSEDRTLVRRYLTRQGR